IIDSGQDNRLTRTQENLIIEGSNLASATAIQILDGNVVLQTIQGSVVQTFIESHNQIIITPGHIRDSAEGADGTRSVVIWNTVGKSDASSSIGIDTGIPVVTGTSRDNLTYDRVEQNLDIYGYGFKSKRVGDIKFNLTHFRIEAADGAKIFPSDGNSTVASFDIKSDSHAILPVNVISSVADGSNRRIRVARSSAADALSSTNAVNLIANITTTPSIDSLGLDSSGNYRRDESIDINGSGLNTTYRIEIINADGSSMSPAMYVDLPTPGVSVDDNGGRIQISRDTFLTS
ncbi:uncharacterized protein METZ01_LOCUS391606, partial [marine metagenome]